MGSLLETIYTPLKIGMYSNIFTMKQKFQKMEDSETIYEN